MTSLYIDEDSKARLCCKQKRDYRFNAWNDEERINHIKALRSYMDTWEWHPSCDRCKEVESSWSISVRQTFNNRILKENIIINEDFKIRHLDISFSNLCNLACRMCTSTTSTWRQELDRLLWMKVVGHKKLNTRTINYLYDINIVKDITELKIFWWEPFLEIEHFKFLKLLVQKEISPKVVLSYNSNLTLLLNFDSNEEFLNKGFRDIFDIWKHFRIVFLNVSLDWFGKVDEYIRLDSSWKDVLKNLLVIRDKKFLNIQLRVSSTIQIDNILDLPNFLLFLFENNLDIEFSANNIVTMPLYYNIQILPHEIKRYIELYYNKFFQKHGLLYEKHKKDIELILKFMYWNKGNKQQFEKYLYNTKIIDEKYNFDKKGKIVLLYERLQEIK